jgi:hypothetical protein
VASKRPVSGTPSRVCASSTAGPLLPIQTSGRVEPRGDATGSGHGFVRGFLLTTMDGAPLNTWQAPKSVGHARPVQKDVWARAPFHVSEMWMCDVCGSAPL